MSMSVRCTDIARRSGCSPKPPSEMKLQERALRWAGLRAAQARICTLRPGSSARAMNLIDTISPEDIRRRAEALGPWFHNIELRGVWTAPNHFLGNYPS